MKRARADDAALVREDATPLSDTDDYAPLLAQIGDARIVLIGEASHGTHEFYRERALITRRLIEEKGFGAVVVEADWPDAYRVNRFVRGLPGDAEAVEALDSFKRFPVWMWRNAEEYYRAMFGRRVESWNLRDTHMMETLRALLTHVSQVSGGARGIIWAHNSHLGDARATQMGESGELNLGQLTREAYGEQVCSLGFTTHAGTVTAAADWDEPAQRMRVRPSLPGSYERLFHNAEIERFMLRLDDPDTRRALRERRLERAIGVIYRPDTERMSHYFHAYLPEQFDAVLHIDETHALEPLDVWSRDEADAPETYPSAL